MPSPRIASCLAYLSGVLSSASFVLMALQVTGHVPIGLAMYAALGAVMATIGWLAMWTVNKVQDMVDEQTVALVRWVAQRQAGDTRVPAPRVASVPVPVPSCAGDNSTTLTMKMGRRPARETISDTTYFAAFDAVAEDVLSEFDAGDGGAETVQ